MASRTEIANLALTHLGEDPIIEITEQSDQAIAIDTIWDLARDTELRAHPWKCAMVLDTLAAEATAPAFGFLNSYQLPTDPFCLRVWRIGLDDDRFEDAFRFTVVGRKLHTDAGAPLKIRYTARITDTEQYDAMLVDALAYRIAAAVAYKLTNSSSVRADMWRLYRDSVLQARHMDALERTSDFEVATTFEDARL